jgi:uncharacterized membrane protein YbaN (DUF454 family)
MRMLWLVAGMASMSLGMVGLVLPIMPTVPFMLLAAFCFARSSRRLHGWLLSNPHFGPQIRAWNEKGAIPRPAKFFGSVSILAGIAISALVSFPVWVLIAQALVFVGVTAFLFSRPDA